ncbi:MAG: hypothetical protein AAFP04_03805 [Myxococcota bacterium]
MKYLRLVLIVALVSLMMFAAVVTAFPAVALSESSNGVERGIEAFARIARVLRSPRCQNCHPAGSAPLNGESSVRHAMNISRISVDSGLPCATCHQVKNSEAYGVVGGPPGAPSWHLPPAQTPMVFQGRSDRALCQQLRDPSRNGGKDLAGLLKHVVEDPLVRWGWSPGGSRQPPPISHREFVQAFSDWIDNDAPCP